jgi:hypothetical protein
MNRFPAAITLKPVGELPGLRRFMSFPQALFRGEGLWLWGCDPTTLIHDMRSGNQLCFNIADAPIPGLFFEAGLSFEEFRKLVDDKPTGFNFDRFKKLPPVAPHQHIRMMTAEIGNSIRLDIEGPVTHAVMWGTTVL